MAKIRTGFFKTAGGVILIIGGIVGIAKYLIESNFAGVLISIIAFFVGVWLISQVVD